MGNLQEFGALAHLSAEAIGLPGRRRFRLRAVSIEGESASVWLEKEQLSAVGDAIESLLKNADYRYSPVPLDDAEEEPAFPLSARLEIQAAQLSMGVKQDTRQIVLIAADSAEPDTAEALSFEVDFRRAYELRQQIVDIVAAGRPPCPLCGGPIDPEGHVCPKSNGHHRS